MIRLGHPDKPTRAVVIAFCNHSAQDRIAKPHVIAQPDANGQHELWNMALVEHMTLMQVFDAFAEDYLLAPSANDKVSFMPLTRAETDTHHLLILLASRLFHGHEFRHLDDKELPRVTSARKFPLWNAMTQVAVEAAYRSQGFKLIMDHMRMVQHGQVARIAD